MASKSDIEKHVLAYFQAKWPLAKRSTKLREELLLNDDQIIDSGTQLAEEVGSNPTRTQIRKCKTIGDLIDLLIATRPGQVPAAPPSKKKKKKSG